MLAECLFATLTDHTQVRDCDIPSFSGLFIDTRLHVLFYSMSSGVVHHAHNFDGVSHMISKLYVVTLQVPFPAVFCSEMKLICFIALLQTASERSGLFVGRFSILRCCAKNYTGKQAYRCQPRCHCEIFHI